MAPNKVFTWHEIMRTKTPFGKFLIFSSPYVCMAVFYYVMVIRPPSLLPAPTNQLFVGVRHEGHAPLVVSSSSDADDGNNNNNNNNNSSTPKNAAAAATGVSSTRNSIFGSMVEPIYGYPQNTDTASTKRRGWFRGGGSSSKNNEEMLDESKRVVTGYRFVS